MFQRLLGKLVSGLVIFFPVVNRGSTVSVRGEFVELGGSLVRVIWHSVSGPRGALRPRIVKLFKYWQSHWDKPASRQWL
jgi:hypothetical protein